MKSLSKNADEEVVRVYSLVIVDDEEGIRNGLAEAVHWHEIGFKIAGLFEDGIDVIQYIEQHHVDVILTDIRMAEVSGLEVAEYVFRNKPETFVVINSGFQDFEYAQQAFRFNVKQYLLKPTKVAEIRELFAGIRKTFELRKENDWKRLEYERYMQPLPQQQLPVVLLAGPLSDGNADEPPDKSTSTKRLIEKAKRYIDDNYYREISLENVAEFIYLHPVYLSRMFKQLTGNTFTDYLTEVRIRRAIELMCNKQYKIHVICKKVGYHSTKYFTRVFKKHTGCTPKEYYRKLHEMEVV
jgi:two-component system response regulator YesN